jgi:hypothetical protein
VLARINGAIEARRAAGEALPPPPKTAIAGPEYFGLTHPAILPQLEALDVDRICVDYWAGKQARSCRCASAHILLTVTDILSDTHQKRPLVAADELDWAPALRHSAHGLLCSAQDREAYGLVHGTERSPSAKVSAAALRKARSRCVSVDCGPLEESLGKEPGGLQARAESCPGLARRMQLDQFAERDKRF